MSQTGSRAIWVSKASSYLKNKKKEASYLLLNLGKKYHKSKMQLVIMDKWEERILKCWHGIPWNPKGTYLDKKLKLKKSLKNMKAMFGLQENRRKRKGKKKKKWKRRKWKLVSLWCLLSKKIFSFLLDFISNQKRENIFFLILFSFILFFSSNQTVPKEKRVHA